MDTGRARFPTASNVDDVFWLKPGEWEPVDWPPAASEQSVPSEQAPLEVRPVADFASAVQRRIDQLVDEDGQIETQVRDFAARRIVIGKERKALEAAVAAYNRVRSASTGSAPRALPSGANGEKTRIASAFLREWSAQHGSIVIAELMPAADASGISKDQLYYALSVRDAGFERVQRGTWRLRPEQEARST